MNFLQILSEIKKLSDAITLMSERFARQAETNKEVKDELVALRKEVAALTTRIAVLEEGRNAIDDRVERKMTEVIAKWQQQAFEAERRRLEEENAQLRQGIAAKEK